MRNIIVLNFESVDRFTYDLLPITVKNKYLKFELPNAIASSRAGILTMTTQAHDNITGDKLDYLEGKGYKTIYGTDSFYYPESWDPNIKKNGTPTAFSEKLNQIFAHYWNTNKTRKLDFGKLVQYLISRLDEKLYPFFLFMQEMDTHNPFNSVYSINYFNMWKELAGMVTKKDMMDLNNRIEEDGIGLKYPDVVGPRVISKMCRLSLYGELKLENFENYEDISIMFKKARNLQLHIIEHILEEFFILVKKYDAIFHIIGDHHTGCNDRQGIIGNAAYLNVNDHPGLGDTIWLTNQPDIDKSETYYTYDFPDIIGGIL